MKNIITFLVTCIIVVNTSSLLSASDDIDVESVDLSDIDMDSSGSLEDDFESEMMLFEDIPVVYSVTRTAQEVDDLSVPVNVIDAEDIHYSGLTNIPDLLKYSLGVDVLMANRNKYRLGMGGLRYSFYDRNVTLINGRNLNNPVSGGTDFVGIPVFMEDIERIEVVRGSGSAAWGTNGFAGVINIVTKRPEDIEPGFFYSGTINEYGDIYNHIRWANKKGSWQWRVSAGFDDWTSTDNTASTDVKEVRDFARQHRFDSEVIVGLNDLMELSFGAAYNRSKRGDLYQKDLQSFYHPFLPATPVHSYYETSRFFTKLTRKMYDNYAFHLQWFNNYDVKKEYFDTFARSMENDLELQFNLDLEKHDITLGTNFRHYVVDEIKTEHSNDLLENTYVDYQTGVYVIDRWDVADRLDLEFQIRGDYYSDTKDSDCSGRAAAIVDVAEQYNQKMRFSINRSYRSPSYGWKYTNFKTVYPNPEMDNEMMLSYQAGYSIEPTDKIKVELDGHYHKYKDTIGLTIIQSDPIYGPVALMPDNNGDLDVLGAEGKVTFDLDKTDLELWCAYDDIDMKEFKADLVSAMPAQIRAGLNSICYLPNDWTFSTHYKFSGDPQTLGNTDPLFEHNDLTVALAKGFAEGNGEIMVGVQNVFSDDYNFYQGLDETMDSVGRTFFGRLQVKF